MSIIIKILKAIDCNFAVIHPVAGFRTIRRNYEQTHHHLCLMVRPDIPVAVLGQSRSSPGRSATCRSLLQRGSYHLSTRRRATLGRLVVRADGVRRRADANARHEPASPDSGTASNSWVRECAGRVGWLALGRLHVGLYDVPGSAHTRRVHVARALPPYSARPRADHTLRTDGIWTQSRGEFGCGSSGGRWRGRSLSLVRTVSAQ